MALMVPTSNNPDPSVSQQFGISGWLDGLANLTLMYGAGKIRNEFPEQFQTQQPQYGNPNYVQDTAINEANLARQQSSNNFTQMALIGTIAVIGLGLLAFVARK